MDGRSVVTGHDAHSDVAYQPLTATLHTYTDSVAKQAPSFT